MTYKLKNEREGNVGCIKAATDDDCIGPQSKRNAVITEKLVGKVFNKKLFNPTMSI